MPFRHFKPRARRCLRSGRRATGRISAVLDIRLADADGIALAKQINRSVPACRIIFLSQLYRLPHGRLRGGARLLCAQAGHGGAAAVALRKALTALASDKALTVRRGASVQRIALDRVAVVSSAFWHRTVIHMTDGDLETTQDPRELLESGQVEDHFIHCHKSFWVNEQMIASMERDNFRLNGGMSFPSAARTGMRQGRRFSGCWPARAAQIDAQDDGDLAAEGARHGV